MTSLDELERTLGYGFKNKALLEEALCHSSFINEQNDPRMHDNERLEFLGDAVLNLVIGHLLMMRHPDLEEGELSRMRSFLVNESQLAEVAKEMDLGSHIRLGKGEGLAGGHSKPSILADAFEAILAAVYLDGGLEAVFEIVEFRYSARISSKGMALANNDFKSQLQEYLQTAQSDLPEYKIIQEEGPDHDKTFRVQLTVDTVLTQGVGKSKKMAEQDAAQKALLVLKQIS